MKKKMFKFISCIAILFMVSCSGDDLLFSYEDDVTTRGLSGRASLTYPMSSFINNVSLSLTDQGSVNSILEELQSNPLGKGYRCVFKKLTTKKVSKISRGDTGTAPASYNAKTNEVLLKTGSTIATNSIQEEFIHAAQDRVYFNGILQYAGKEGTPNIEFEAKIIQELIYCANGYGFGGLGAGPTHADDYTRWIMLLCEDGFLDEKFPSLSEVLSTKYAGYGYYNYMEFFKVKDPGYNKGIIYNMQPSLLDYISNNYGI